MATDPAYYNLDAHEQERPPLELPQVHSSEAERTKDNRAWDLTTTVSLSEHSNAIWSVDFNSSSTLLASGGLSKELYVHQVVDRQADDDDAHDPWPLRFKQRLEGSCYGVRFSTSGAKLAAATGTPAFAVHLFSMETFTELGKLSDGHSKAVNAVDWANDRYLVSSSDDGTAILWDTDVFAPVQVLRQHTDWVSYAGFSMDRAYIVTTSRDTTFAVWSVDWGDPEEDSAPQATLLHVIHPQCGFVRCLAMSPVEPTAVVGCKDGALIQCDLKSGRVSTISESLGAITIAVVFNPTGQFVLSGHGDNRLCIHDVRSRELVAAYPSLHDSSLRALSMSRNGSVLVTGSSDVYLKVHNLPAPLDSIELMVCFLLATQSPESDVHRHLVSSELWDRHLVGVMASYVVGLQRFKYT